MTILGVNVEYRQYYKVEWGHLGLTDRNNPQITFKSWCFPDVVLGSESIRLKSPVRSG